MKFEVDRDSLFSALQRIQSVVEKKNTVQILSNILCVASEGKLFLSATDLEVGMRVEVPVKTDQDGKITLSGKHFLDIIKELPSKPVKISRKSNDWVEIVSGKSRFSVVSLAASEFPTMPSFEEKKYHQAKGKALNDMIHKTWFAVSTDATRYHLNGVYFESLDNAREDSGALMRMTATDGHRLSFVDQEVFLKMPDLKKGMIIPKKGLGELKKILDEEKPESIRIAFDQGYFYAHSGSTYLFIRLIEGEYPDYRQVIPKATEHVVVLSREDFTAALRRVSLLAHEKSRGVKFSFKPGVLMISTSNPDTGEATEDIEIEYTGDAVEMGFNARYLLDCLPTLESEELEFKFKDRLSPGVIQGKNSKNHTYIIMPMRI